MRNVSLSTLVLRGLRYHWRSHLAVAAGAAVTAVALTGALAVGDSLQATLRRMVDTRLGRTTHVVASTQGTCTQALADTLHAALGVPVAPVYQRLGSALADGGRRRAHHVVINGVDRRFWATGVGGDGAVACSAGEAVINRSLAGTLGVQKGDQIVVKFQAEHVLPMEAPFSGPERNRESLRLRVAAVIGPEASGDFSLKAEHYAVHNVFVPLQTLAAACGTPGEATALLVADAADVRVGETVGSIWSLDDAGFYVRPVEDGRTLEIHADRIFLSDLVVSSIVEAFPGARPMFAYFVNSIACGDSVTPYSFVSTPPVRDTLGDSDILLNSWTAQDLAAGAGDTVVLSYYVPKALWGLREERDTFTVAGVVPQNAPWSDSTLMPPFPGLADAGSCTEWEPGTPIELDRIRPKDEAYWERWRGTPKAFVGFRSAQRSWRNRFGSATAVRVPTHDTLTAAAARGVLRGALGRVSVGLIAVPVRAQVEWSVSQGTSFSSLFTGLSVFLIGAALVLTGLLFSFTLQSRSRDYRALVAAGYSRRHLSLLFLGEGAVAACAGAAVGACASPAYAALVLVGLNTIWGVIAQTPTLELHVTALSMGAGAAETVAVACAAMLLSVRTQVKTLYGATRRQTRGVRTGVRRNAWYTGAAAAAAAALGLVALPVAPEGTGAAEVYFGAGSLMLAAGLMAFHAALTRRQGRSARLSVVRLAFTNVSRRRGRSVAAASLFASALFVIGTMSLFRLEGPPDPRDPQAGTGGFWWYGETVTPFDGATVSEDSLGLVDNGSGGSRMLAMRLREGDDASCFTLNRVARPPLVGIDAGLMDSQPRFTVTALHDSGYRSHPWHALLDKTPTDVVPGFADQSAIEWGLGLSLGDTLFYTNERGVPLKVVLVGGLATSVFQGRVLIDERRFAEQFPGISGYRLVLAESAAGREEAVRSAIERRLDDAGVDLQSAASRLASFTEVENTYLAIFSMLGALGLLLGSVGVGIVVMRNALERRGELAALRAQGFTTAHVRRLLLLEHAEIFGSGIVIGLTASLVSVLPSVLGSTHDTAVGGTLLTTALVAVCALISTWAAATWAGSGAVLATLSND